MKIVKVLSVLMVFYLFVSCDNPTKTASQPYDFNTEGVDVPILRNHNSLAGIEYFTIVDYPASYRMTYYDGRSPSTPRLIRTFSIDQETTVKVEIRWFDSTSSRHPVLDLSVYNNAGVLASYSSVAYPEQGMMIAINKTQ